MLVFQTPAVCVLLSVVTEVSWELTVQIVEVEFFNHLLLNCYSTHVASPIQHAH